MTELDSARLRRLEQIASDYHPHSPLPGPGDDLRLAQAVALLHRYDAHDPRRDSTDSDSWARLLEEIEHARRRGHFVAAPILAAAARLADQLLARPTAPTSRNTPSDE